MRKRSSRHTRMIVTAVVTAIVVGANAPLAVSFVGAQIHEYLINRPSYKRRYGYWETFEFPSHYRVNAVHAALLNTGKVLLMAGSGNNAEAFARKTFRTLLWDPAHGTMQLVPTPSDVFCGGHAFLPNGNLLIAGGTQRYEVLAGAVKDPGGGMDIINVSPHSITLPKDTRFVAPNGRSYLSNATVSVTPARSYLARVRRRLTRVTQPGFGRVWVDSVTRGPAGTQPVDTHYALAGQSTDLTGIGDAITLQRQFFQGTNLAYIFDAANGRYDAVESMIHKRWYPSLAELANGNVIAVSGLDGTGDISDGHTEIFETAQKRWVAGPVRYFPTYPALFLLPGDRLFFSGANTGYGPPTYGRTPGIWDLQTDAFQVVGGIAHPDELETAASLLLPPAQSERVMLLGGGGVGSSEKATSRTAIVDLRSPHPRYVQGPSLPHATRYPLAAVLPNDTVFVTGGSRYYRGNHLSDNHDAEIYNPATNRFTPAAVPEVGRDYHSEILLLPDGRVATFGSNPLWADKNDTRGASFEQRVEIYSPPYLFWGPRPVITGGPASAARAGTVTFTTPDARSITKLRLIHPGAYTHVTDLAMRSVALPFRQVPGGLRATIPSDAGILPSGWYMLFAVNRKGVPSVAKWVKVT